MKTSVAHLPDYAKADLKKIVALVLKKLPHCEMIILYGSYARGTFVKYDERVEFGVETSYMSDYDILVVTSGMDVEKAGRLLDDVESIYFKRPEQQVPVQFINDDIEKLNSDLSEGRYFYTDVKREGIMLYDSKRFKLERARKLNFDEIRQQAEEYFDEKFENAAEFMIDAKNNYDRERYKRASFMLHQACENLFYAIRLVFTLKKSKQHNLSKLLASTHKYVEDIFLVFPRNTKEERRLFKLLRLAYVEARYNPQFVVTPEDIEILTSKVELFRDITEKGCKAQIERFRELSLS